MMQIIINNKIYDITTFIDEHPGGRELFILNKDHTMTLIIQDIRHMLLVYYQIIK